MKKINLSRKKAIRVNWSLSKKELRMVRTAIWLRVETSWENSKVDNFSSKEFKEWTKLFDKMFP